MSDIDCNGKFYRALLLCGVSFLIAAVIAFVWLDRSCAGPMAVIGFACMAVFVRSTEYFKGLSFTLWVLASVTASMYYPQAFIRWGSFELSKLIVPLIQLIMFGMGTTLCIADFTRVLKMPKAFIVGMCLQFTVMPLTGLLLAKSFGLDPMISVGIILVGSCPGGVASNVITYLARGNVALSVTMTACSTLASPIITPFVMKMFANQYTHIDFFAMMIGIVKMIIIPIFAGLIANRLLSKYSKQRNKILPVFSMVCLCLIITIITSLARDSLLTVGFALFAIAVLHNAIGYTFGYWGAKLIGLDITDCRTVAIEVGLQNGGMASGLALNVLKSVEAGLAPAIFGVWQNVSGSILASIWGRKRMDENADLPTSRSNIYYWKCDNPLPVEEKLVYNKKYELADISGLVREIAVDYFGDKDVRISSGGGEGNHYTYIIGAAEKKVFFRADDGKIDDDYMVAEGAAMSLVKKHGVCVPQVYHCDVSMSKYPIRFQIMELMKGECLNKYYRLQTLDKEQVCFKIGTLLAKMHGIKLDGFGFFNTNILQKNGKIIGIDKSNKDYFYKRLDEHLKYLRDTDFLSAAQTADIEAVIEKHSYLLDVKKGSVLHKDVAFWNIMGSENDINAIIDWDDVVIGDPADDIAVMRCFYDLDVMSAVYKGYSQIGKIDDVFMAKSSLYLVRNMLWKAVIRSFMKYFEMDGDFFLTSGDNSKSLKQFTHNRLFMGVDELKRL